MHLSPTFRLELPKQRYRHTLFVRLTRFCRIRPSLLQDQLFPDPHRQYVRGSILPIAASAILKRTNSFDPCMIQYFGFIFYSVSNGQLRYVDVFIFSYSPTSGNSPIYRLFLIRTLWKFFLFFSHH